MRIRLPLSALLLVASACSSSSAQDAADTGTNPDATAGNDASTNADAAASDSATPPDAGSRDVGPCEGVTPPCVAFTAGVSTEMEIREAFVSAGAGTTLAFGPGTFAGFKNRLSISASRITVKGAGMDQTILDFKAQEAGAEGVYASDVTNLKLMDFAVLDTPGNGIKVLSSTTVTFDHVKASWTATTASKHGAYGFYPVVSKDVLVQNSFVSGASDTGIYVGQSKNIIIRNNTVKMNVAGIEIENSYGADVHDNDSEENTAGILVFDLPNLPQKGGNKVRVYNNTIKNNNTANFAPMGNIVGIVPAGTGFFVMANHDVEVFNNHIEGNHTGAIAVISYFITQIMITDPTYYPWPQRVYVHDNMLTNNATAPDPTSAFGMLEMSAHAAFTNMKYPDLVYDGVIDPTAQGPSNDRMLICFENNGSATFANLHVDRLNAMNSNLAMILTEDLANFTCNLPALPPVVIPGELSLRRHLASIAALFFSAALLAGCGGSASNDGSPKDAGAEDLPSPIDASPLDAAQAEDATRDATPGDAAPSDAAAMDGCTPGGDGTYVNAFYAKLSDYCLVRIENGHVKPLAGIPYDLNTPLFSDGAIKVRTAWLPPGTHATYSATTAFSFPQGTIITKSFGFKLDRLPDPSIRWIETRLLIKTATVWKGISYIWNADYTEARRSFAGDVQRINFIEATGTTTTAHYLIPDANQCRDCHAPGGVMDFIGPKARNLNRSYAYEDGTENQLEHWSRIGLLTGAPMNHADAPLLPVWNDPTTGSTTARARAYLEVNCAHCHNGGRGTARSTGLVLWASNTDPTSTGLCKMPVAAGGGSGGFSFDVVPGDPDHSVLTHRMAITEVGKLMPPISRSLVDRPGLNLVRAWIRDLPGTCPQ